MKLTEDQKRFADMVAQEATRQGVNPQIALSVAFAESRFNPTAMSPKGAIGLMQLMPKTAEDLGVNPSDVEQNIRGGVQYLKQLSQQFKNDPVKTLSAYNAGPNARFFETGDVKDIPTETLQYVSRIAKINGGQIPNIQTEEQVPPALPSQDVSTEPVQTLPASGQTSTVDPSKITADIERRYGQIAGGGAGLVTGAALQTAGAIGSRLRGQPAVAPSTSAAPVATPTAATPTTPTSVVRAPPGAPQPPLGGSAVQNYARAFGLGDIEAGRALDMTKQPGGVHDLTTQRRLGLQRVNELFPNQFREDPRFGGLLTPEERPGLGPRGPSGQIGAGKPPPIVSPPGPLSRITRTFERMAEAYPRATRGVAATAQRLPIISYPLAGANIGGETISALQQLSAENPDYVEAGLSGLGALGTGLSMFPATAPIGIPMALTPPLVRYFRDRPPEEHPSLGLNMP
jgi:hypothetical protein